MFMPNPCFEQFLAAWHRLPRRSHPLLPCRSDVSPLAFGELLHFVALTERRAPRDLHIIYAGSGFEHNAGLVLSGRNYYDLLPESFHGPMQRFHDILFDTPCGASVCDVIATTGGSRYTHETLQLPLADDDGAVRYLMGYGLGRKPFTDTGTRTAQSHQPSNIKDLNYLDLGAGAPTARIDNFIFMR